MATITVNDVRLAYDEVGAGPPVVWVHGSWTNRHGADQLATRLADEYRVISYDRRGHSESERPPGSPTVATHAADLTALIEQLDAVPAHLVANSFGGAVALKLAGQRPELVASLCLHEPPVARVFADDPDVRRGLEEVRGRIAPVLAEIRRGNHETAARLFMETVAMGPGAWARLPEPMRLSFAHNAPTFLHDSEDEERGVVDLAELRAISAPTLLTDGARTPPEFAASRLNRLLAAALPNARQYTFDGAGHTPHYTHLDELVRVVKDAIATSTV